MRSSTSMSEARWRCSMPRPERPGSDASILVSSGAVLRPGPGPAAVPSTRTSPPVPDMLYGITKLAAEGIASRLGELRGVSVLTVRLASVYGAMERRDRHAPPHEPHPSPRDARMDRSPSRGEDIVAGLGACRRRSDRGRASLLTRRALATADFSMSAEASRWAGGRIVEVFQGAGLAHCLRRGRRLRRHRGGAGGCAAGFVHRAHRRGDRFSSALHRGGHCYA